MGTKTKIFVYAVAVLLIIVVTSWTTAIINSRLQAQGVVNNIYSECNCTVPIVQEPDSGGLTADSRSSTTTGEETTTYTDKSESKPNTSSVVKTTTTTEPHINYEPEQNDTPEYSQPQEMKSVNINSADAEEISECLLLDIELAQKIVDLRTEIQYFSSIDELFMIDGIDKETVKRIAEYVVLYN